MAIESNAPRDVSPSGAFGRSARPPASSLLPTVKQAAALIGYATNRAIQSEQIDALCKAIQDKPAVDVFRAQRFADHRLRGYKNSVN